MISWFDSVFTQKYTIEMFPHDCLLSSGATWDYIRLFCSKTGSPVRHSFSFSIFQLSLCSSVLLNGLQRGVGKSLSWASFSWWRIFVVTLMWTMPGLENHCRTCWSSENMTLMLMRCCVQIQHRDRMDSLDTAANSDFTVIWRIQESFSHHCSHVSSILQSQIQT